MPRYSQIQAKKGIYMFWQWAVVAKLKEYRKIHDMKIMGYLDPDTLISQQKKDNLRTINLIKEKRCGKIKGCTYEYGSTQRKHIPSS